MKSKTILEIHNDLLNESTSVVELVQQAIKQDESVKNLNAVITTNYEEALKQAATLDKMPNDQKNDPLFGIVYSLKDNICTRNLRTTGGSLFLDKYVPVYNATVYDRLLTNNAVLLNKSNLDEFGLGGSGLYSAYGQVKNPLNSEQVVGGSSSGSAVLVQQGVVQFAIATDTGDSIRRPASIMGIIGYKPTYGLISRYGVLPYAPSMDHVGILARHVEDVAVVLNAVTGYDDKDNTSIDTNKNYLTLLQKKDIYTIAVLKPSLDELKDPAIKKLFKDKIDQLAVEYTIREIDFDYDMIKTINSVYQIISYTEALSSYANLSNITFGQHDVEYNNYEDLIKTVRTQFLGQELKHRFAIGAYVSTPQNFDEFLIRAMKMRHVLVSEINKILESYDFVLSLGAYDYAEKVSDVLAHEYEAPILDNILQLANFAGLPSLTIPFISNENGNIGLNITSGYNNDDILLNIGYQINLLNKNGDHHA
ncbi:aspartyl/glutamyl-tRNA amidotransferase subunit A [Ureaplasma miroungigenitalium]|uniref:Aspartyl/glutamyl-tRNA amidotransferase subunit A n=1 Tax=Ureaplasma miroungigenitalium TaxID=1042321 RepID=A0ABT3BMH1_9BACT|nr:aspartyl/glutamyl-tRNA amidotransferase subunit A [Ureaplasma miroungigenitalium]MCV3728438.1 aspartyl/glutamyl-tRNA amidotransferase subunit A [Ureaplasma miroungigenitalium]MCV3734225.1 aspartyl/glutamyl-tRNA amidotransferase subunit A [Ureaplasma miroungigenitalium]